MAAKFKPVLSQPREHDLADARDFIDHARRFANLIEMAAESLSDKNCEAVTMGPNALRYELGKADESIESYLAPRRHIA